MVHFKHKTYTNVSGKSPQVVIDKVKAYLTKQRNLEIFISEEIDGELFIAAMKKHDILNRMVGNNYTVGCGVKKENGEIKVRVGDPQLVLGTGIFAHFAAADVFNDVWAIIDSYLL